jgi:hypothetical protein
MVFVVSIVTLKALRGRTLLAAIFDEVAYWRDETSAMPDAEAQTAVMAAFATVGGMLIALSSPYRKFAGEAVEAFSGDGWAHGLDAELALASQQRG